MVGHLNQVSYSQIPPVLGIWNSEPGNLGVGNSREFPSEFPNQKGQFPGIPGITILWVHACKNACKWSEKNTRAPGPGPGLCTVACMPLGAIPGIPGIPTGIPGIPERFSTDGNSKSLLELPILNLQSK